MTFNEQLKKNVHQNVHPVSSKLDYSISFYTGGLSPLKWHEYTPEQQKKALSKYWYIRWSYRHPGTGKLVRQKNIKDGVNRLKTFNDRMEFFRSYKKGMIKTFNEGFNPYNKNGNQEKEDSHTLTAKEAIEEAMEIRKLHMQHDSYTRYKSDINKFVKYLDTKDLIRADIKKINKKIITSFLNESLKSVGARSVNNYRTNLRSLWETMLNESIVEANYVATIPSIRSKPVNNKVWTDQQAEEILSYLEKNDPRILLVCQLVAFNILRIKEVCRLTVGSFDLRNKTVTVFVKKGKVETRRVPDIIMECLPDMDGLDRDINLIGRTELLSKWDAKPESRRGRVSDSFREIKDHFGYGPEYGINSFRHYGITKIYRSLRETRTPLEAKTELITITGHDSIKTLDYYLRTIGAELAEDYSQHLK